MRGQSSNCPAACTAVVTEVSYRSEPGIYAAIEFLSENEWREVLRNLIDDTVEEVGEMNVRLRDSQAWQKVTIYRRLSTRPKRILSGPSSLPTSSLRRPELEEHR